MFAYLAALVTKHWFLKNPDTMPVPIWTPLASQYVLYSCVLPEVQGMAGAASGSPAVA